MFFVTVEKYISIIQLQEGDNLSFMQSNGSPHPFTAGALIIYNSMNRGSTTFKLIKSVILQMSDMCDKC